MVYKKRTLLAYNVLSNYLQKQLYLFKHRCKACACPA
jgi:hypothetical protein